MARAKKKVSCQDCNKTFGRKGELQQHRREEHSRRNMCPICKRAFESEKRLKMHSQFHNVGGEYKCFYCPKQFNKAWKMKIHLVNHSGRPSYICEYCGDDFLYPGKIVMHLKRIHDVCYACKDCGHAIPIDLVQKPHKCRIYGCKDCLASFATEEELAEHVKTNAGQCSPPARLLREESGSSSPPQDQCEGYLGIQGACDAPQELPVSNGREENGDCDSPDLVVVEDPFPAKTNGIERGKKKRGNGASRQGSGDVLNGVQGGESCRRDSISCSPPKESCETRLQSPEVNGRLSRDVLVSPSPPSTPFRCSVPNYSDGARDNMSEWTVVVQEHRAPLNKSVIGDREKAEAENGVEVVKDADPPSYFSSILMRSPSRDLRSGFKVPDGTWRKVESPTSRSLRRKQDELDRAVRKRELLNTLHVYVDTDARLTQRSQTSFKSWLTGDSFSSSSPDHDYVFGFEASVSVGNRNEETHRYYFNKKIPKKAKVDMTFEDLCLF